MLGPELKRALCFVCLLLLPTGWAREGRGQPGVPLLWEDRKPSPLYQGWNKHSSRQARFIFSQVWFEFEGLISACGGELSSCEIKTQEQKGFTSVTRVFSLIYTQETMWIGSSLSLRPVSVGCCAKMLGSVEGLCLAGRAGGRC